MTIERLLLLNVLLGEPVILASREHGRESVFQLGPKAKHSGGKELDDERRSKSVDDQAAESVPFRVNQAIGVGNAVES